MDISDLLVVTRVDDPGVEVDARDVGLAEANIGADQRVRVTRLVAAVDAGRVVNPGLVRQQVEGGLLAALAAATVAAPEYVAGMPRASPYRGRG
jgi:isoquinoline 1-oxidoreductase beta subunit